MKAGTAQKMTLNMITTSVMIKLGHVIDNKMVDMKLTNTKFVLQLITALIFIYIIKTLFLII